MRSVVRLAAAVAALAALASGGQAQETPALRLTNASSRYVACTVVVDDKAYAVLRLKAGQAWSHPFSPVRKVKLVCERAAKSVYGPLDLATPWRLVDGAQRVELVAGE